MKDKVATVELGHRHIVYVDDGNRRATARRMKEQFCTAMAIGAESERPFGKWIAPPSIADAVQDACQVDPVMNRVEIGDLPRVQRDIWQNEIIGAATARHYIRIVPGDKGVIALAA